MTQSFTANIEQTITDCCNNPNVLEGLKGLIQAAKILHAEERNISLLSVRLVGLLEEQNGAGNCWLSRDGFAWHIGLTPNTYWKRAQAWRVLKQHPEIAVMVENGETCVSQVAMLAAKITEANAAVLIAGIKNKSTRALRDFIATVNPDGSVNPAAESFVEVKLRLSVSEAQLIERAREVLARTGLKANGAMPSDGEVVVKALQLLLDRKDPLRQAERAVAKSEKIMEKKAPAIPAAWQEMKSKGKTRPNIPSGLRHKVWQRDKGSCTHDFGDGHICGGRHLIEIDHLIPWGKGGTHTLENLALKCREHNMAAAEQSYGAAFMNQFRDTDRPR